MQFHSYIYSISFHFFIYLYKSCSLSCYFFLSVATNHAGTYLIKKSTITIQDERDMCQSLVESWNQQRRNSSTCNVSMVECSATTVEATATTEFVDCHHLYAHNS